MKAYIVLSVDYETTKLISVNVWNDESRYLLLRNEIFVINCNTIQF